MTQHRESNPISRLWNIVAGASAAAVAIHYAAPWKSAAASDTVLRTNRGGCAA
ncbi:hypothetical protein [Sphingopyxis sp.]|jgi:hypothetical protein|uniref:hypothetical protein n=1 Tax=Sphingopyxis sp. TaxID=1908224 RepID=UPI002E0CCEC8|nr:hypothetical protein [Sphingopyxis sp.]